MNEDDKREALLQQMEELNDGGEPGEMHAAYARSPAAFLEIAVQSMREAAEDRRRLGTLGAHWNDAG